VSDELLVAVVAGVSAVIGGIIGTVGAPLGKNWVARKESERIEAQETKRRDQERSDRAHAAREASIRRTLDAMVVAGENYEIAWTGYAHSPQGRPEVIRSTNAAWSASRELPSTIQAVVDQWKATFDAADMRYREGTPPPGLEAVRAEHARALEAVTSLLTVT